ncbi:MAG: 3-phosphoshikimate 1-carboxyvinyltransferase [Lentisphaerae bacterium]|nr:3-phosphoshikimate 1-carboxyvinyltransferase [Lentisphaerota bacterium]
MDLKVRRSSLEGSIAVSGSKSHTIRAVVCALAAEGESIVRAPLESADTLAALNAAKLFGAQVVSEPGLWRIKGVGAKLRDPAMTVDMMNSGTGLRLLSGLAALQDFTIKFDGDESLRTRKMAPLLEAFEKIGAKITSTDGKAPFSITGPVSGGNTSVDGTSSQFLSSLLFSLPLAEHDSEISLEFLLEQPYVGITLDWLKAAGVTVTPSDDWLNWKIPGNQKYRALDRTIPADFSTAAFPLVAGVLSGKNIEIRNLDFNDPQGDKAVFSFVEKMGANIMRGAELSVNNSGVLRGTELDLNSTPDALPILAVLAAFADGKTLLGNVPQARLKETDRIAVMAKELAKVGVAVEELEDGLIVHGGNFHGGPVESYGDHRIAMAFAVAGTALPPGEELIIRNAECAKVSYPDFIKDFKALGADFSEL